MKKFIASLLVFCLMAALWGCGSITIQLGNSDNDKTQDSPAKQKTATLEGPGFDTPEDAIVAYAEALKKGDVQKILSTFAIESYVKNFDLEAYLEQNRVYSISIQIPFPVTDEYTTELAKISRQAFIVRSLSNMYLSLGDLEDPYAPVNFNGSPYNRPAELIEDITIDNWMDMLSKMKIGDVHTAEAFSSNLDALNNNMKRQANALGCSELVPLAVEVTLDGVEYYLCADIACYDGRWYVCNQLGTIASILGADSLTGGLFRRED